MSPEVEYLVYVPYEGECFNPLTKGKTYEVRRHTRTFYNVKNDHGRQGFYLVKQFMTPQEFRTRNLKKILA